MRCMRSCLILSLTMVAWAASHEGGPWTDVWTMPIRGEERTFVDHDGGSYLVIDPADFQDKSFLKDKDVMFAAQFERQQDDTVRFFDLPPIRLIGRNRPFDGVRFGDNLWVLGRLGHDDQGRYTCMATSVLEAPSDAEVLAARIRAVPEDQVEERLALAAWMRSEAAHRGNRELWLETSMQLVTKAIEIATVQAARDLDVDRQLAAMRWAVELLDDTALAAELAAAAWLEQVDQIERNRIEQFMHKQGFIQHDGAWIQQAVALRREYRQRLAAIDWRDADAHFDLARWIDSYGDVLPEAEELRHKVLQDGLKADPYHAGIRSALNLSPKRRPVPVLSLEAAYNDPTTGLLIPGIADWPRHEEPIDGLVSWGPGDAPYYVSLDILQGETAPADLTNWVEMESFTLASRNGFEPLELERDDIELPPNVRLLACRFKESTGERIGLLGLILLQDEIEERDDTADERTELGDVEEVEEGVVEESTDDKTPEAADEEACEVIGIRFWCSGLAEQRADFEPLFIRYLAGLPAALAETDESTPNDDEKAANDQDAGLEAETAAANDADAPADDASDK